jgi:CDP-diacylglycerol--glycerol-3-phosphate 3-phosphatidyltransferase
VNLPNKLTVSRFAMTALFLWCVFTEFPFHHTLGLVLFCLAGVTDYLDGHIARARNLITNFGILMDPLADKILTCSAFIAFVESTHLNEHAPVKLAAWMVVIIVARELAITGLRLLAASKNVILAAERYGKHKTAWQLTSIITLLVVDALNEWPAWLQHFFLFRGWSYAFAVFSLWITVTLTAVSGLIYLWRNRTLYLEDL